MTSPSLPLNVPVMDEDHARLEAMLERVAGATDAELPALLLAVEAETRSHFDREVDLMRAAAVPIVHCHIEQHSAFLREFARGHDAVARRDMAGLRQFLGAGLPQLLLQHVDTVDRVTASFLQRNGAAAA